MIGKLEWLVHLNDVRQLWDAQPTYLISQFVIVLAGIVTCVHAFKKGGRWPWFWLATIVHGLISDNFWHVILPEYDNFWHSQTPVMLFGLRQPLHILFLYPAFIYNAAYAVSKLNLNNFSEPFAVGLVTVLIDIPYDIVSVKFVHWTWHDTDPNIFDRHYWVPWNSYYFHATFATSLVFLFHILRKWSAPKVAKWESAGFKIELRSFVVASITSMFGGILMFVPIYHPLHDILKLHSEITFFLLFTIFVVISLLGLLSDREVLKTRLTKIDYVLILQLALHYIIYWIFVVFFSPETHWSLGVHEPVGPCNEVTAMTTALGQTVYKRKYLCLEDYDERYFDFHCVGDHIPQFGEQWYAICGTPFENRAEYIIILTTILILASGVFYSLYFKTITKSKKFKTK